MSGFTYRVHPAIGIARVGNSEEYYIGPETMAGVPVVDGGPLMGGLPIKADTLGDTITSGDLRDGEGALKRQAARFRIYQYPQAKESYPTGVGTEVTIGSVVEGKTVADIVWSVHLANKKAYTFLLDEDLGLRAYEDGKTPALRNLAIGTGPLRSKKLIIDPGPRTIRGGDAGPVRFDKGTVASYWDPSTRKVQLLNSYSKSFPDDSFPRLNSPSGQGIESLGGLLTDGEGRLLVLGGYGRACGFFQADGPAYPLNDDVNNDGWFDDVADGPVRATLVFNDGSVQEVQGVGWAVSTDPSYAPQIRNIVTLWDDVFDTWVRTLNLCPDIYDQGTFVATFAPSFDDDLLPIFRSASLQRWATNLPNYASTYHDQIQEIKATDPPSQTLLANLEQVIRNPDQPDQYSGTLGQPLMPLSLGDAGESFLAVTRTQYFTLAQWNAGKSSASPGPTLGPGEYLDKAVLVNCLGGRFSPGIDLTFIVRDSDLYVKDWQTSGTGPFRINPRPLDYGNVRPDRPLLTEGYVPLQTGMAGLEPGDVSKFMAIPWHTDYNSCATHLPSPNPAGNTTLFWSWPAQRPVAVYAAEDVKQGNLPTQQRFSVRGQGTETDDPAEVGRYQQRVDMLGRNPDTGWQNIGFVIQGNAIDGPESYDAKYYLEVESRLKDGGNPVRPWPNTVKSQTKH